MCNSKAHWELYSVFPWRLSLKTTYFSPPTLKDVNRLQAPKIFWPVLLVFHHAFSQFLCLCLKHPLVPNVYSLIRSLSNTFLEDLCYMFCKYFIEYFSFHLWLELVDPLCSWRIGGFRWPERPASNQGIFQINNRGAARPHSESSKLQSCHSQGKAVIGTRLTILFCFSPSVFLWVHICLFQTKMRTTWC